MDFGSNPQTTCFVKPMIDFKQAISTAQENLQALQPGVQDVRLEAAMLNPKGDLYEISLSYRCATKDELHATSKPTDSVSLLMQLALQNRIYKTFFVERKTGAFRGFKEYQEA